MSSIEDLAIRVGSYIPRSAGMGLSYFSGSISVDPDCLASGEFPGVRTPRDEYIPSIPELNIHTSPSSATKLQPDTGFDDEDVKNAQNTQEDADETADGEFTPEEQRVIDNLKTRDREVRDHEQAHVSVGGAYIRGGAMFEYESGPDKKRYAVGGEVNIDASPVRDNPEATITKMQVVRAAALAPAQPSGQDRAVAAAASQQEGQARAELAEAKAAEARGDVENGGGVSAAEAENRRQPRAYADAAAAYAGANLLGAAVVNYAV